MPTCRKKYTIKYKSYFLFGFLSFLILTSCNAQQSSLKLDDSLFYYNATIEKKKNIAIERLNSFKHEFEVKELLLGHNNYWIAGSVIEIYSNKTDSELKSIALKLKSAIPKLDSKAGISVLFKLGGNNFAIASSYIEKELKIYKMNDLVNLYFDKNIHKTRSKGSDLEKVFVSVREPEMFGYWQVFKDEKGNLRARSENRFDDDFSYLIVTEYGFQKTDDQNEKFDPIVCNYILFGGVYLGKINGYYVKPESGKFEKLYIDLTEYLVEDTRFYDK